MRNSNVWKLVALGAVVVGLGTLGATKGKTLKTAVLGPPDRHLAFQFDWPRGEKLTYAFTWRGQSATALSAVAAGGAQANDAKPLEGSVDLDGDLVIESLGVKNGAYLLREHVENVRRHEIRVLGSDVLPTDADAKSAFEGKSALVAVDGAGAVRAMYFAKDESTLFEHVMQSIVTQTTMTVAANHEDAWDAVETSNTGTANVHYEVEELGPPRLLRHRSAYTHIAAIPGRTAAESDGQLAATSTLVLDPAARRLTSLTDDEDLALKNGADPTKHDLASRTHFELTLRDVSRFDADDDATNLAQLDVRRPGELEVGSRADRQIMDRRVAGLTLDELRNTILAYGATGDAPSAKFLSRASGYLKLHPEACMDMAALFEQPALSTRGRKQVLELLAGTGTPEAQQAMRAALESPVAHADKRGWEDMVQRFSIVQRPTTESVQFVAASYRDARDEGSRAAAAYALGASAGNLAKSGGDRSVVRASEEKLVAGLRSATTATERKDMLGAIGNLELSDDEPVIAEFAKDDSPEVRGAAAWALRSIDDEGARSALMGIAADSDPGVAAVALQAIGYQTMTTDDWRSLARVVTSGGMPAGADNELVSLLSQHTNAGQAGAEMLQALAARNTSDNPMEARIQHVLQNLQSGAL